MNPESRLLVSALPGFLFDEVPATDEEITDWKTVVGKIISELMKESQLIEVLDSFNDNFLWLGLLINNCTVTKMIGEYATKIKQLNPLVTAGKKNTTKAASIRLLGNSLFVKKEYLAAFKMYSRGLMFASNEDKETPLLYANRSAVYFYLNQYENTLEDIERALKFGYRQLKPIGKLLIRKGFSLLALGRDDEVKELLDTHFPAIDNGPDSAQWKQLKKESENVNHKIIKRDITLSQFQDVSAISTALTNNDVFRPHERFPWLNAKIDLLYDAEKGYSLVAKEELKYGEIVALNKPFANMELKHDSYERCHYCMVPCFEIAKYVSDQAKPWSDSKLSSDSLRMVTPLPCSECCNVLYCSEACRTAAWTAYHRFECSQMAMFRLMDSKVHLALRMLFRLGTLDVKSAHQKMAEKWAAVEDHLQLMVNQEAYSFVFLNPFSQWPIRAVEKTLEMILTVLFHLKLLQMTDFFPKPRNNRYANRYIQQAFNACGFLYFHLCQLEINESVSYFNLITERTVTPSPVLSIDGMMGILKHSCEATVATSSLLTESFGSTVKLLYATGGVSAGTVLTLAYDTVEHPILEQIYLRKVEHVLRYNFDCTCTRCIREVRDSLDNSAGLDTIYYPIACSACGSLMVRAGGEEDSSSDGDDSSSEEEGPSSVLDNSYRCSSTNGCNVEYSVRQMKNIYRRVEKMMQVKRQLMVDGQIIGQSTRALESRVAKLVTALQSTVSLLYGGSLFLAHLYAQLAQCYLLLTVTVTLTDEQMPANFSPMAKYLYSPHLPPTLLYTGKALDILETLSPCVTVSLTLTRHLEQLLPIVQFALSYCTSFLEDDQRLGELGASLVSAKDRYETLLKKTAFDNMVASSLPDQK